MSQPESPKPTTPKPESPKQTSSKPTSAKHSSNEEFQVIRHEYVPEANVADAKEPAKKGIEAKQESVDKKGKKGKKDGKKAVAIKTEQGELTEEQKQQKLQQQMQEGALIEKEFKEGEPPNIVSCCFSCPFYM